MNEERQAQLTLELHRPLATDDLMERIVERDNLKQAWHRVKSNQGAAGIDGRDMVETIKHLNDNIHDIKRELLEGRYIPQAVRGVKIPKPTGGERQLGIPTVKDRWIQQAILQVLSPLFEAGFSESSYGFRPGRSAHMALKQARIYVQAGKSLVVDIDLEKFFDNVNHDRLMNRLAGKIADKRLLKLIRDYLRAGLMQDGVCVTREKGTPQGGPLSPLLSNIVLDELDKELEARGHPFCRYADDCNIYVKSVEAGKRVLASLKVFLADKLKLKVNDDKSAVALVSERKFLGYRLTNQCKLGVSRESQERFKKRIRAITKRNRGRSLDQILKELAPYLRGWLQYYRLSEAPSLFRDNDQWIRRRLRCYWLKQKKRGRTIAAGLIKLGVREQEAYKLAGSSKGWWRLSLNPAISSALSNAWFKEAGLYDLSENYRLLKT